MDLESKFSMNFVLDNEFAWNNQLLVFDPERDGKWSIAE